jgi:hypothetical protein
LHIKPFNSIIISGHFTLCLYIAPTVGAEYRGKLKSWGQDGFKQRNYQRGRIKREIL